MASRALLRRKKEEKKISKKLGASTEHDKLEECPVFKVHYLGKIPARGEYGREFIDEPVEMLLKLKDRQSKLPKTVLQITEKGFHFLDVNGPFGKEKHVLIPIHHVCYGVADEQNPEVFAIIARTDSNPENSLLECHAFLCDRRKIAAQITYWLLRTFLHVFEELQRRRQFRQERKLRRLQEAAMDPNGSAARQATGYPNNHQGYDISPTSPTDTIAPEFYSITVEGSKENGAVAAVSLTKSRPPHGFGNNVNGAGLTGDPTRNSRPSSGKKFATVPSMRYGSLEDPVGSGARRRQPMHHMHNSHESLNHQTPLNHHNPLRESVSAGASLAAPAVVPRRQRKSDVISPRPTSFNGGRTTQIYPDDARVVAAPATDLQPPEMPNGLTNPNAPLHHQQQERARYMKNPNVTRAPSPAKKPAPSPRRPRPSNLALTAPSSSRAGARTSTSTLTGDLDFIFIQVLQDEFSVKDDGESDSRSVVPARKLSNGSSGAPAAPPLDQKLSSADIERRIREWLKRTSPDAEYLAFDDSGLDKISLAGTLAHHNNSPRNESPVQTQRSTRSQMSRRRSQAGTFHRMPSNGEYF